MDNIPESIQASLANPDPAARLEAVAALLRLPITLPALYALERLAANDPDPTVRSAALDGLRGDAAQSVYTGQSLPREARMAMVQQIDRWQIADLITREQADVLRLRYGFDLQPALLPASTRQQLLERVRRWTEQALITPAQAGALAASLTSQPSAPGRVAAPSSATDRPMARPASPAKAAAGEGARAPVGAPSPSLSQILFSETSIRIALFLGGFLIVAAALILAALVEVVRIPVLLGLAGAAGTGALISRRRLPLPSFVLYIIFASLLPILARVLADLLHLSGPVSDAYWSAAWLALALALAVGTRLYASPLLSFAALGGLVATAFELTALLQGEWRALGLLLGLVAIVGGLGAAALMRWKNFRFALPLYLGAHLVALSALQFNAVRIFMDLFLGEARGSSPAEWLYYAFAWAAAAAFYLITDRAVRRVPLLPYLAAAALLFFPATFAQAFTPSDTLRAALIAGWGVVYALSGAALDQRGTNFLSRYGLPLMLGAPVLFAWAALLGIEESTLTGLALLLTAAVVLTALNIFRPRVWAWSAALLFGLMAYFTSFELPLLENLDLSESFIVLMPGLLLIAPEFFTFSAEGNRRWRVPTRWLGIVVLGLLSLGLLILAVENDPARLQESAVIFAIMAAFFLALALRRGQASIAIAAMVSLPAALVMLLLSLQSAHWLPWLAGQAVIFYAAGHLALRRGQTAWSDVFRFSGLALGLLAIFRLPYEHDWVAGLSMLAGGGLFLVELLRQPRGRLAGWLEIPMNAVFVAALFGLLNPVARADVPLAWALGLLLAALIVLGFDLLFTRAVAERPSGVRWAARCAGMLLGAASLAYNILTPQLPAGWAAVIFTISAAYTLLAARAYPLPRLGYALTSYLALALLYLLRAFNVDSWLAAETALAALFYAGGFVIERRAKRAEDANAPWAEVLKYGGLALAMIISLTAPLERTELWPSLWVACAATLYAIEAFRRRSVWWGFPTDGLYLLAYFLLLIDLKVDQPQFFSIAVAALGMLQHYLLVRTGSRVAAFLTGMVSQLVLLGTTYYQMVSTEQLSYFVILFFQGLGVLVYGIIIRSRSLVITPLIFTVLGVMTVVLSILSGVPTAIIIGCTGIILLTLGILAVVLRERLVQASEKMGGWRA